jgi:hypothetical protein
MTISGHSRLALLAALLAVPGAAPAAGAAAGGTTPPIETRVSEVANLVHWVDNLAGSSIGKTSAVYRRYWQERFGPITEADRAALERFARIRNLPVPSQARVANENGCLPLEDGTPGWHQRFMAESMKAGSVRQFVDALSGSLQKADRAALLAGLETFRPRFEKVWKDMGFVQAFERRFDRYLVEGGLRGYLLDMARFFGVAGASLPAMKISFIALPAGGRTHAEADGDHLLVEVRPEDAPQDQVQVIAHEAAHFMMQRMSFAQLDALARQTFAAGDAGAATWRYLWESMPTALGQGLAESRLTPQRFSMANPWYHIPQIDRYAKLVYPAIVEAMERHETIHDGVMPRMVDLMERSPVYRQMNPAGLLMTAFYISGDGLEEPLRALRHRLGLGTDVTSRSFALADPSGADWLKRYACMGGLALIAPAELDRAAALGDERILDEAGVAAARALLSQGQSVVAAGRRRSGGVVFLVIVSPADAGKDIAASLARVRGIPAAPVALGAPGASSPAGGTGEPR